VQRQCSARALPLRERRLGTVLHAPWPGPEEQPGLALLSFLFSGALMASVTGSFQTKHGHGNDGCLHNRFTGVQCGLCPAWQVASSLQRHGKIGQPASRLPCVPLSGLFWLLGAWRAHSEQITSCEPVSQTVRPQATAKTSITIEEDRHEQKL